MTFMQRGPLLACLAAILLLLFGAQARAEPLDLPGKWYQAPPEWDYRGQADLHGAGLAEVSRPALTGGRFWHQADFSVGQAGNYVVDFKNSGVIGRFRHFVFDTEGRLLAERQGGIENPQENPFFLRHGREVRLAAGRYRLLSELESPFFLAESQPYVDTLAHYRQAIKPGNALALAGLGVFLGLGVYYAALAVARRGVAEAMYALFILGNLLFNAAALQVFPELFGLHWFYLVSAPILVSNCAYILFAQALLEIRRLDHPRLYWSGMAILGLLVGFILLAAARPHWSLELDRYGVALFLTYGLIAGIVRTRQGNTSARLYLVAILAFALFGVVAISQTRLEGLYTIYLEHVGLGAVVVEVVLLALVLSYQFAQLVRDKEYALLRAEEEQRIARTDPLTGLPNRYALEIELARLPLQGSLTFIDLDGLKYYNDRFGHASGDDLLRSFAVHLTGKLGEKARVHRLGGDEFALTCPEGDVAWVERMLEETLAATRRSGFEFAGASAGSVHVHENPSRENLKHLADTRMYENKHQRKAREVLLWERH